MASGEIVEVLYIGFGAFLDGVPARDMTADEWAALPETARGQAVALDLYQVVTEEGGTNGRADAPVVGDDTPGAADDGVGHRGVSGRRGRKTEG